MTLINKLINLDQLKIEYLHLEGCSFKLKLSKLKILSFSFLTAYYLKDFRMKLDTASLIELEVNQISLSQFVFYYPDQIRHLKIQSFLN